MANIDTTNDLREAIHAMELEQHAKGQQLKEDFHTAYNSINPVKMIKDTIREISAPTGIVDNLIVGAVSLATGFLTKRLVVGTSTNIIRKLIGSVLQVGTTRVVSNSSGPLLAAGKFVTHLLSSKRKKEKTK